MINPIPIDLKYTTSHEWLKDEGDDILLLGITAHAQELLGDVVFVELPDQHKMLKIGDSCAVVESVKAAADVYCPVAGEVIEVNAALVNQPELINHDPYEKGWICRVRLKDKSGLSVLLNAEDYKNSIESEAI